MYFTQVDKNKLAGVLEFLVDGFGWSSKRHNQIKEYITFSNSSIEFYGFAMYNDKGSICSAILLPYQGYSDKYKIISLMSWYSQKSYRGINSIIFIQKVCKFLLSNQFIITDYTPTKTVTLILKSLNFKIMNGFKKRELIIFKPHKLFFNFLFNKTSKILEKRSDNSLFNKFKVIHYADAKFLTLDTVIKKTSFYCISRIINKKIISFNFSIPIVHILWAEDQNHLLDNWDILSYLLFKKYNSFCVIADFAYYISSNHKFFNQIRPLNYLISSDSKDLGFIPSLGSELCLTNKNF